MFLVNWFWGVLNSLGLANLKAHILFLGLDNAGKTTLLRVLKDDKVVYHNPTRMPQYEELVIGNIHFKAHDLGGHTAARRLWKQYFAAVDGIVFLVDSADKKKMSKAKEELNSLLMAEELQKVPFMILGNKVDKEGALSKPQLKEALGITHSCTGEEKGQKLPDGTQPMEVFMCSVIKRAGYAEGFRWLSSYLQQ
jgi:GTP-binding protein SAR1